MAVRSILHFYVLQDHVCIVKIARIHNRQSENASLGWAVDGLKIYWGAFALTGVAAKWGREYFFFKFYSPLSCRAYFLLLKAHQSWLHKLLVSILHKYLDHLSSLSAVVALALNCASGELGQQDTVRFKASSSWLLLCKNKLFEVSDRHL